MYQAVPVYYAARAIKQSRKMAAIKRVALIAHTYNKFVALEFLKLPQESYEFGRLIMDFMGKITVWVVIYASLES